MDRERVSSKNNNPSFSSTLLDAIYRSIDEGDHEDDEIVLYRETISKKQSHKIGANNFKNHQQQQEQEDLDNFQRAFLIEKWMQKKVSEKVVFRRKSAADLDPKYRIINDNSPFFNSSSSSSGSSSGAGFSSSETESGGVFPSRTSCYGFQKPKPIRTSLSSSSSSSIQTHNYASKPNQQNPNKNQEESNFLKTKSRALKIYSDLKKVKQPISPGAKLSNFLNSLFTAGNTKKAKISSNESVANSSSTCSSASSFSRSCLSKTPSSRGKSSTTNNGMTKRSVRFVDEDYGQKSIRNSVNEELKIHIMEKNRRVEEAARDLLRNYQKKVEFDIEMRKIQVFDDEEDDAASYASSDLFELDNLSAIGGMDHHNQRYCEELPVYETTHLDTNRAIANGFIL